MHFIGPGRLSFGKGSGSLEGDAGGRKEGEKKGERGLRDMARPGMAGRGCGSDSEMEIPSGAARTRRKGRATAAFGRNRAAARASEQRKKEKGRTGGPGTAERETRAGPAGQGNWPEKPFSFFFSKSFPF